jgi:hypothetical protein
MNKNLYKNGILTLYLSRQPQYTVRQYYAQGGIATLVPRKGFFLGGIGNFVGDLVGGVGDAIGGIADFAGDVIDSPIGRIGLTLLAPQFGIPAWAASAGLTAYDFAKTGKLNPLSALSTAGLYGLDQVGGIEGLSNMFGSNVPVDEAGGFFSGKAPDSIFSSSAKPSGIFSGDVANIENIQGIRGIGNNLLTPTQDYLSSINPYTPDPYAGTSFGLSPNLSNKISTPTVPNQYENVFTGAEDSTNPLTTGDGSKYVYNPATKTVVDAGAVKPGFFGTAYGNLKTAFDPASGASAMDRLSALGDVGSSAFKALYTNKDGDVNVPAVLATLSLYPNYAAAKAKAGDFGIPFSEADYQANKVAPSKERYAMMAPKSAFGITTAANGGRIGFDSGGPGNKNEPPKPKPKIDLNLLSMSLYGVPFDQLTSTQKNGLFELADTQKANGGRIGYEDGKLVIPEVGPGNKKIQEQMMKAAKQAQQEYLKRRAQEQLMNRNYNEQSMYDWKRDQKELFDAANEKEYPPLPTPTKPEGVLSIKLTPAQKKAYGGMIDHPVRMLQGGVPELDLRAKGGFIPYGVKERADDVPAMLSKNEFVFTADAVRNAGGGSINKGAQKMYKLMKSLENKKVKKKVA